MFRISNDSLLFSSSILVQASCRAGKLCIWRGLEVSIRLGHLYRSNPEVAVIMSKPCRAVPVVGSCLVVHFNTSTSSITGSSESDPKQEGPNLLTCHLPHCISFGSDCVLDIHTVCALIEAMNVYGNSKGAVRLAVALSVSIVSFYRSFIQGEMAPSSLPVTGTCFLGKKVSDAKQTSVEAAKGTPMEEEHTEDITASTTVWPEDTLLTVTTFAFLFNMLSKRPDVADAVIVELSLDWVKTSQSLMFQLGLTGLFVPKFPTPTAKHEVSEGKERRECWWVGERKEGRMF